MISVAVDTRAVTANINKLQKKAPGLTTSSLEDAAYELLRLSQQQVPHDEGILQNSGVVETAPNGRDIILGYHTPYAARLHEHPEYNFQKGRKGKYIEDPIYENKNALGLTFGTSFQRRLF